MARRIPIALLLAVFAVGSSSAAQRGTASRSSTPTRAADPAPPATAAPSSDVDAIVSLVQAKMSEAIIINSVKTGGVVYKLTPQDLLKLQKAGASNGVIEAMMATASPAPAAAPAPATAAAAPSATPSAPAPAPAPAAKQEDEKKGGLFSRIGGRLKQTAQRSADKATDTAEAGVDNTASSVDKGVDNATSSAEAKADNATKKVTGTADKNDKGSDDKGKSSSTSGATSRRGGK